MPIIPRRGRIPDSQIIRPKDFPEVAQIRYDGIGKARPYGRGGQLRKRTSPALRQNSNDAGGEGEGEEGELFKNQTE